MQFLVLMVILMIVSCSVSGCKKEREKNRVDLDQIEADDSNDYRYIFRDIIREQERQKKKNQKNDFSGSK
ncbi:MAG: hypothetical protein A2W19_01160 [Spirochaetes bacterium RBG_16_49_21]|nr:MAG: hypothetical protein A2W19_01160 [Spirochaetes bacterium RBG_16_49_21]